MTTLSLSELSDSLDRPLWTVPVSLHNGFGSILSLSPPHPVRTSRVPNLGLKCQNTDGCTTLLNPFSPKEHKTSKYYTNFKTYFDMIVISTDIFINSFLPKSTSISLFVINRNFSRYFLLLVLRS